jgi:hypothetical protein
MGSGYRYDLHPSPKNFKGEGHAVLFEAGAGMWCISPGKRTEVGKGDVLEKRLAWGERVGKDQQQHDPFLIPKISLQR